MRREGTQSQWERTRLTAANMFEQGLTTAVIAASLESRPADLLRSCFRGAGVALSIPGAQ